MTFAPIPVRTISTSAPYSYRQGMTFLERMEELQTQVNIVADQFNDNTEAYASLVNEANTSIQTALDSINGLSDRYDGQLSTMRDEFTTHTQAVAQSLSQLNAAIASANAANDTANGLATAFNAQVDAFQSDVDTLTASVTDLQNTAVRKGTIEVNVKDYGAVGNDVHDDTQNIVNAITAAGVGGRVFFPKGSYVVSATINTLLDSVIIGAGGMDNTDPGTRIRSTVTNGPAFYAFSSQFIGMRFDGPDAAVGSIGVSVKGATLMRDCVFYSFDQAVYMRETWYAQLDHCYWKWNKTNVLVDWCYNVSFVNPRMNSKQRDGVSFGKGIDLVNSSMVTCHGGSIEQYTTGVTVRDHESFTAFGTYFESSYPGAKGVSLEGSDSAVTVIGCQVYPGNHRGWIDAASGAAGNTVTAMGNKFKSSGNQSSIATAYYWGSGNTERLTTTLMGDSWGDVIATGYQYTDTDVISTSGSFVQYPVGSPHGPAGNGGHIVVGGSFEMGQNRQLILGHNGLPGSPLPVKGAMVYDPQTSRPVWGDGAVWRDAMGNAI